MMGTKRDYYEILGIQQAASLDDIKKVYRQLAMKYHPDRVPEEQKKNPRKNLKKFLKPMRS